MTMENWTKRLHQRMKEKKFTQESLGERVGASHVSIGLYLSGKRFPRPTLLLKIARALQCDPAWLEYGVNTETIKKEPGKKEQSAAGVPILSAKEIETFLMRKTFDKKKEYVPCFAHQSENSRLFSMRMEGDALTAHGNPKSIQENELLIIDPDHAPKNKDIVAAKISAQAEPILRQYIIEGGIRYLKPFNSQYPMITMDSKTEILGVVVAAVKNFISEKT